MAAHVKLSTTLPTSFRELLELPGVGLYVASAVAVRVGGEQHAMLDTNMSRLLKRYFGLQTLVDFRRDRKLRELAIRVVRGRDCLISNLTILDLGSQYCTSSNPNHEACPLRNGCRFYHDKQEL